MILSRLKYDKAKKKDNIKIIGKSFQQLPVEIILKIFDYLSPKQLTVCALVCRLWHEVANSNEVWRKLFQIYHINKPRNDNISIKKEYIKRSREYITSRLLKEISLRRKHHLFPDFSEIRKLDVSIVGEIFDDKSKSLIRNSEKIKSIMSDSHTGVRFNWQKKIDKVQFPMLGDIRFITLTVLIPGLIKSLVPIRETINNHIEIRKFDLKASILAIKSHSCSCREFSQYFNGTIDWHFCVPTFLIGLWPSDQSVAYLSCFKSLMEIQMMTERFLIGRNQDGKHQPHAITLGEAKLLRFSLPCSTADLKCTLLIENIEPSETLLFNCWRSVDYFQGSSLELIDESDQISHLQIEENFEFRPSMGHLHLAFKNIIKVEVLIVSAINDPLWSYSSAVVLTSTSTLDVEFIYRNTRLRFNDGVIKGTLTCDSSGRMYLTQLSIL